MSQGGFSNPLVGGGGALVYPSIHSPNFNEATQTGWSIDKNGNAFFYGITTSGEFTGTNFVINSFGAFFYSGTPALGKLVLSVTQNGGTDTPWGGGNAYLPGFTTYNQTSSPLIACSVQSGQISFQSAATAAGPWGVDTSLNDVSSVFAQGTMELGGALFILGLGNAGSLLAVENLIAATSPLISGNGKTAADVVLAAFVQGQASPTPGFQVQANGQVQLLFAITTGEMLVIENTASSTGSPNVQLTGTGATDNMLGIDIAADSSNRFKINASGLMQWGSGSAGPDARLYRTAAGQLAADTILANIAGAAEVWHTLGTLAGATVALGQFRLLPTGMVAMDIEITFAVSTAVPINFSVTIPAAYRPLNAVDFRFPMAQTNAAGAVGRIFVGSAGGASPGQVQLTTLGAANVIGTYSAHFQYPVI